MHPASPAARRRGVTLLELAIVLLITSILSVTAFSYYAGMRNDAKVQKAMEDMNTYRTAIKLFMSDLANTTQRRPTSARELVKVYFAATTSVMVGAGGSFTEDASMGAVKRNFIDGLRKSPWGLDYNIDLYNVVAWNTDRRDQKIGPVWGKRLTLPYTNINTDNFDAPPNPTLWGFSQLGSASWSWATGAVTLSSPSGAVFMNLCKEIRVKGMNPEAAFDPGADYSVKLMNVEWGSVIQIRMDYTQSRGTNESSLDDGAITPDQQARYQAALVEHAVDYDPVTAELEKNGAILLWPKSKLPALAATPTDVDFGAAIGLRFSERFWEVLPNARVAPGLAPPDGSTGEWGPGEHDIKFVTKYDEVNERYLVDISIDGDFKDCIKLPSSAEDTYWLTLSPDQFSATTRDTPGELVVLSVTVSSLDFSKYYTDLLWPDARAYGR